MSLAEVSSELDRGVGIARLRGEVDASNRNEVLERLLGVLRNADWGMVLDLTGLRYLDSAGIDLILRLTERLRSRQQELRIVATRDGFVSEVLEVVRLAEIVPIDEVLADSVQELREQRTERREDPAR